MKRIAIFGGSFDPVHLGHVELAKCALESCQLERVILMPCWQSPFKGRTIASAEQRFDMLLISVEEQGLSNGVEVSDYELSRPERSFSWQTAEEFDARFENVELCWILGTDQWEQIEQWAQPGKLRELLHFIVVTRDGQSVLPRQGWKHSAVEFSHPASSTKIREAFDQHRQWLSPGVADYCQQNRIYH